MAAQGTKFMISCQKLIKHFVQSVAVTSVKCLVAQSGDSISVHVRMGTSHEET